MQNIHVYKSGVLTINCLNSSAERANLDTTPKRIDYAQVQIEFKAVYKTFGPGTVTELGGGYITVAFGEVEKKFLSPAAFKQGFLNM